MVSIQRDFCYEDIYKDIQSLIYRHCSGVIFDQDIRSNMNFKREIHLCSFVKIPSILEKS